MMPTFAGLLHVLRRASLAWAAWGALLAWSERGACSGLHRVDGKVTCIKTIVEIRFQFLSFLSISEVGAGSFDRSSKATSK